MYFFKRIALHMPFYWLQKLPFTENVGTWYIMDGLSNELHKLLLKEFENESVRDLSTFGLDGLMAVVILNCDIDKYHISYYC